MGYEDAEAYLDSLGVDAMKSMAPSLHRIEALCAALDHPERRLQAIHITGTNGKTSTARIATSLLSATGLTVGTYTSPHLESVRERIALSGEPISEAAFGEAFDHLRPYLGHVEADVGAHLTYFEVLTGLFFLWAAETPVDAVVIEVGLGGRWDATNVVDAPVAVITNIGLDHTGLLGDTREAIAAEKVGIVKPGSVIVTGERSPAILELFEDALEGHDVTVSALGRDFHESDNRVAFGGRYVAVDTSAGRYDDLFLPLHGSHQGVNAAIALEAITRFLPAQPLAHDLVLEGLGKTSAPGRIETFRAEGAAPVVLDVAHNPDGMSAFVTSIVEAFAFERALVVLGVLADKDYRGMLAELARMPCSLVVAEPRNARAVPASELADAAGDFGLESVVADDVPSALSMATESAAPGDLVVVTGSHYVVGEARPLLARAR
ncbi:MAG TPA: folylpolyglutamate synthase/dihydrofolate synthase family protein [Actinomycetota bacterium]